MEIEGIFKNEDDVFIKGMLDRVDKIRREEFEKLGYEYKEFEKKEKEFRECKMELRDYQQKMRKQVILNRGKSSKNEFIEHETVYDGCDNINLFEDDLFVKVDLDENGEMSHQVKKESKKVNDYTDEELVEKIEMYLKKKNIELDIKKRRELDDILKSKKDWRKCISLDKDTGDICKVNFIIKGEYRDVQIKMEDDNKISKEEMKVLANRKKLLNRFKK
jgi:hypothetical protein